MLPRRGRINSKSCSNLGCSNIETDDFDCIGITSRREFGNNAGASSNRRGRGSVPNRRKTNCRSFDTNKANEKPGCGDFEANTSKRKPGRGCFDTKSVKGRRGRGVTEAMSCRAKCHHARVGVNSARGKSTRGREYSNNEFVPETKAAMQKRGGRGKLRGAMHQVLDSTSQKKSKDLNNSIDTVSKVSGKHTKPQNNDNECAETASIDDIVSKSPGIANICKSLENLQLSSWSNSKTIEFCKKYKVMYIMRGLPGSGKSTLAKNIYDAHKDAGAIICSADDFRYDEHGNYTFDVTKLAETHGKCQEKARIACKTGYTVIIDNTNIKRSEFQAYINIAKKHSYHILFVKTSEWNVDVLTSRNKHNVPRDKIKMMKSIFEPTLPHFYSWSLPASESDRLKNRMLEIIKLSAKHCSQFLNFLRVMNVANNFHNLYTIYDSKVVTNLNHVTAFYPDKGKSIKSFAKNKSTCRHLGLASQLNIIGVCVTSNAFFARVQLDETHKEVWGHFDDNTTVTRRNKNHSSSDNINKILQFYENFPTHCAVVPYFDLGCSAHITLGIKEGMKSVQSRQDIIKIIDAEINSSPNFHAELHFGHIRKYHDGWVIYFEQPFSVDSMFVSNV